MRKVLLFLLFTLAFFFGANEVFASETEKVILTSDPTTEFFNGIDWQATVPHFVHPAWPQIEGATWVWKSFLVSQEEANNGIPPVSLRKKFNLPWPAKGTIRITADNAYELYIDGKFVGKDGILDVSGTDFSWETIEVYEIELLPGPHEFIFRVINYKGATGGETPFLNPAGLLFKAELTRTSISVPYRNQTDSPWGSQEYDHANSLGPFFCGRTIAACGCALTSAAMLLKFYGVERSPSGDFTNPDVLNNWLRANQGYIGGDLDWQIIKTYSRKSNKLFGTPIIDYLGIVKGANFSILNSDLKNDKPVILQEPGHFIVATNQVSSTYSINDPRWRNKTTLESYNNKFLSLRRYAPTHTDLSGILIATAAPTEFLIIDSQGRRTGKDPNTGQILEEIPNTSYYLQTPLIDDTFEDTPQPPEGSGTFFFEALDPEADQYKVMVFGNESYLITFRGYDQDAEVSEKILQGTGPSEYILDYSPEMGSQINVTQIVDVDIKPGSDPNPINLKSQGEIPVAILTTPDFDASTVDVNTIEFGTGKANETHKKRHLEDVDNDGDLDLVLHFKTQEIGIQNEDTEICLIGKTTSGIQILGCDSITVAH